VAVIFYAFGAAFAAALEVIIYAGAIMVLFVFAVMTLNLGERAARAEKSLLTPGIWIGPGILAAVLAAEFIYVLTHGSTGMNASGAVDPKQVGIVLYGSYFVGVELASMLLLAGLVGAYHLGWRRPSKKGA
jgi:NADH-quinone oxidoreductase subunit J